MLFTSEVALRTPDNVEKAMTILTSPQNQGALILLARGDHMQPWR
jgi:hypothetical protein